MFLFGTVMHIFIYEMFILFNQSLPLIKTKCNVRNPHPTRKIQCFAETPYLQYKFSFLLGKPTPQPILYIHVQSDESTESALSTTYICTR
jgi:hypothetical protein